MQPGVIPSIVFYERRSCQCIVTLCHFVVECVRHITVLLSNPALSDFYENPAFTCLFPFALKTNDSAQSVLCIYLLTGALYWHAQQAPFHHMQKNIKKSTYPGSIYSSHKVNASGKREPAKHFAAIFTNGKGFEARSILPVPAVGIQFSCIIWCHYVI